MRAKKKAGKPEKSAAEIRQQVRRQTDEDWGDDEPAIKESQPAPEQSTRIVCETCGEKFNDAKSCGIHKTRVHFGRA